MEEIKILIFMQKIFIHIYFFLIDFYISNSWRHIRSTPGGAGQVNTTTFSLPLQSIGFWGNRLKRFKAPYKDAQEHLESYV